MLRMEQALRLAHGAFPAAGEDQHRGVQAGGGVEPSRALGNHSIRRDTAGRRLCLQQYMSR
jgi:hypothetical protein